MKSPRRKKIFVTGGSGFLGANLVVALRKAHDVSFSWHRSLLRIPGAEGVRLELDSKAAIAETLSRLKPEAVIHCAAATDVDFCEEHPQEAQQINTAATRTLAEAAKKIKAHLLFISTEAVYEGTKGNYSESDSVAPINHYARTKWEAEEAIREIGGDWFIARTGFEGWRLNEKSKLGFLEWLIQKFEVGKPFTVFRDRLFTPISVYTFSAVLKEVVEKRITGLFNAEGSEKISYLDFARRAADIFGYEASLLLAGSLDDHPAKARRPKDTSLNSEALRKKMAMPLPGAEETLRQCRDLRESGRLAEIKKELAQDAEKK